MSGAPQADLRIALVAPMFETVPPKGYGSVERVVHWLAEGLVGRGHRVTLWACAGSCTAGELRVAADAPFRSLPPGTDRAALYREIHRAVFAEAEAFDLVHVHTAHAHHLPFAAPHRGRTLTTYHYRLDRGVFAADPGAFAGHAAVALSRAQAASARHIPWAGIVGNGVPAADFRLGAGDGGHLLFLGRIGPDKRPDRAVRIAALSGMKLVVAAKVDGDGEGPAFWEDRARHAMGGEGVEFAGEVDDAAKAALLCDAAALLFPIDWPEPFGLVLLEAMACGTPSVAWRRGAAAEIVEDGVTGFLVDDVAGAVRAVARCRELDRAAIRARFEARFTAAHMVAAHEALYRRFLDGEADFGAA